MDRFVNGGRPTAPTLILPVDQAEELFGANVGEEADGFLTVFAELLKSETSDLPIMAVATIRSDLYELFQTAPQLVGLDAHPFDDLKPMRPDRFREVICGPAARAQAAGTKLQWAPEVVDRLLQECDASADALPLLSLTLAGLYEDYGSDGEITLDEYEAMGGMRRVVESVVDGLLSTDPDTRRGELEQLRHAFIPWMATINPVKDLPLRRVARWGDLPADSHRLIDALVAKRLLVKDERGGEVVVEVALESLLRQWDALAGWLREETTDLKDADFLDQAVHAWTQSGFNEDWLLEGARLTDAESLAPNRASAIDSTPPASSCSPHGNAKTDVLRPLCGPPRSWPRRNDGRSRTPNTVPGCCEGSWCLPSWSRWWRWSARCGRGKRRMRRGKRRTTRMNNFLTQPRSAFVPTHEQFLPASHPRAMTMCAPCSCCWPHAASGRISMQIRPTISC